MAASIPLWAQARDILKKPSRPGRNPKHRPAIGRKTQKRKTTMPTAVEYAVMLAVILVIVVGTIRLIGSNANNVFSNVASSIQ